MNIFYYIAGSDGSGKTSLLIDLEKKISTKTNKTVHIWIRSPKIFSKPLMGYCRLMGLTKYTTIDGVKYCNRELYKSKFVSYTFPILQLIDFKIKWYFERKKINNNDLVLLDRFSLDTLADLMIDTKRMDLHKSWIGKQFLKAIPKNTKIIILKVDEEVIRKRKIDTLHDVMLKDKVDIYQLLSKDLKIKVIENNNDYNTALNKAFKYISHGKD
jgi:thymidylate kinase